MAYTPPPPGSTEVGKPTPSDVPKQSVEIKDLPPEVRRSFLLSMVFFPSIVGASVCFVVFLGYYFLSDKKSAAQYAAELREGVKTANVRTRWVTARNLSEAFNSKDRERLYDPDLLSAMIEVLTNPALDEDGEAWSPSDMIRAEGEKRAKLRFYIAPLVGLLAAEIDDPRGAEALLRVMAEEPGRDKQGQLDAANLRAICALTLGNMHALNAVEPLKRALAEDPDERVRVHCALALGSIAVWMRKTGVDGAAEKSEDIRLALRVAFERPGQAANVLENAAVALARLKDPSGRAVLEELSHDADPNAQRMAKQALEALDAK